jgi:DMSO reductase family type II enzyme heme b subunit
MRALIYHWHTMLLRCRDFIVATAICLAFLTEMSGQPSSDIPQIYLDSCATCHGAEGRGDGRASYLLSPKPRDFMSGAYRFKSTPGNQLPTDADLQRVIDDGIERTAMPAFKDVLSPQQITQLAAHVLSLNSNPNVPTERDPVALPDAPAFTPELIAEGKSVYAAAGCAACHGETGRGDGPSSYSLKDEQEYPLPPPDFTTGVLKAGRRPVDIYRSIVIGVPGTPMPSFADSINQVEIPDVRATTDRIWAMVAYIQSVAVARETEGIRAGATLSAIAAPAAAMAGDPLHPAWRKVQLEILSLQPLWQRKQAARAVEVKAIIAADEMVLHLAWPDTTVNATGDRVDQFTDAVAVMFSLDGHIPSLAMGAASGDPGRPTPVNLWHWKASRQLNADAGELQDVASSSNPVVADLYMYKTGDPAHGPLTEHDPTFIPAWKVGNLRADPRQMKQVVLESNAMGFGSLALQPEGQQDVRGRGLWSDGRWHVVLRRPLAQTGDGDVDLASATMVPLAFAVWDGEASDRNGTKLITGWHRLQPSREPTPDIHGQAR